MALGSGRRLDIQGLRAVAVLMVVMFHAKLPVPGGFLGVDVFFVISGFVITAMLYREHTATGRIRFARFYTRRFKRLAPALTLTIITTLVASALVLSPLGPQELAAKSAIGSTLFVANLAIATTTGGYWGLRAESNPLLNTWSLSVEEQFYLAFPAILAAGWYLAKRTGRHGRAPRFLVSLIIPASFGLALLGATGYVLPRATSSIGFYSPLTRAWEFAVGAFLFLAPAGLVASRRNLSNALGILGAGMLGASLWLVTDTPQDRVWWTLLPVTGTLLVILAGSRCDSFVTRALATRPLIYIGDRSYSIYLWHWPLIVFASSLWPDGRWTVPAAALSLIPALASYRWVERPVRSLQLTSPRQLAPLGAALVSIPLIMSGSLLVLAKNDFWSPEIRHYRASLNLWHAGLVAGCDTTIPQNQRPPGECVWNGSRTGAPIYLVGDSNADHFSEAIVRAGATLDRPVVISTTRGCPFVDVYVRRATEPPTWSDQCRHYVHDTLGYLSSSTPGLVIISGSDQYWRKAEYLIGANEQTLDASPSNKIQALATGLTSTVEALRAAGQNVLLVQTVPHWTGRDAWDLRTCPAFTVFTGKCRQDMPVGRAQQRQGAARQTLNTVARRTGAGVLDLWSAICPRGICSTQHDDLVRYRDGTHISVPQSEALARDFELAIVAAGHDGGQNKQNKP